MNAVQRVKLQKSELFHTLVFNNVKQFMYILFQWSKSERVKINQLKRTVSTAAIHAKIIWNVFSTFTSCLVSVMKTNTVKMQS